MAILTHISSGPVSGRFRHRRPTLLSALLALALGWLAQTWVVSGGGPPTSEYQVKAAFLVNFPKYVDWPVGAFAGTNSPIVIAVVGESEVAAEIQNVIANRRVHGRELVLKRLASGEASSACHILFISAAEQKRSPSLLAQRKDGVLTVGESNEFLERGGTINLARRNEKIALEVNLTAAEEARIKLSSKLLSVATVRRGKSP